MDPAVDIEVMTDRDVDQEREELFSRAVRMRGLMVGKSTTRCCSSCPGSRTTSRREQR
jgi:hypothetical protein